ncbi:MAG: winged helix-turn-helix transcriptional regulator [Acidobacteria bacterium]|nr:winged helix-turn-helix transcriptional regulator [Acidobacteriota bacterium]
MARPRSKGPDPGAEVYSRHAEMCKVFSHPLRLQVLNTLRDKEMSVSDLADRLGVAIGNLSQHLNMMKQRRVVMTRKEGNNVYYRLANAKMLEAFDLIREILFEQMRREGILVREMERGGAPSWRHDSPLR